MELISLSQAARLLGYGQSTVYALVRSGRLPVVSVGEHRMAVERHVVEEMARAGKPKRGRPRKEPWQGDADATP